MGTPTPRAQYVTRNSMKRVFPGGSSIDAEVVEISRPINWSSKSKSPKQKQVICHETIDVDVEEDVSVVKHIEGNVKSSGKGKDILVDVSLGHGNSANSGPVDGAQSSKKKCPSASDNLITIDDYVIDEHIDMYYDDFMKSHFDNMDIPPGVEAPIPWMPSPADGKMASRNQSTSFSSSTLVSQPTQFGQSWSSLGPALGKERLLSTGSSNFEGKSSSMNLSSGAGKHLFSHCRKKHHSSHATASYGWDNQSTPSASYSPNLSMGSPVPDWTNLLHNPTTQVSSGFTHASGAMNYFPQEMDFAPLNPGLLKSATTTASPSIPSGPASNGEHHTELGETLKKLRLFKKFDTVQDYTDHYYSASSKNQPSKNWAKKIQEEWKILEKDLPDTIFVRVYETRMDLLRAVIKGADGTPYHDGLFFFDVLFPSNYPNVPPQVHYHSFGLRLNPNLYACGKVCLSLLNTWSGTGKEKWIPRESTMLQVLVSIQGLILNAKPYFNEPGWAGMSGTPKGEASSLQYNENTYILNLKTMVFSMRRPPKHFEDFVIGYFVQSALDILVACKTYTDGAQVGSLVKGGVQDVDEGDKSCSPSFKASLAGFIKTVIDAFTEIGAKDCEKFLYLAQSGPVTSFLHKKEELARENELFPWFDQ